MQKFHSSFYIAFYRILWAIINTEMANYFQVFSSSLCNEFTHNKVTNYLLYFVFRHFQWNWRSWFIQTKQHHNKMAYKWKWLCLFRCVFSCCYKNKIQYSPCPHALDYDYLFVNNRSHISFTLALMRPDGKRKLTRFISMSFICKWGR